MCKITSYRGHEVSVLVLNPSLFFSVLASLFTCICCADVRLMTILTSTNWLFRCYPAVSTFNLNFKDTGDIGLKLLKSETLPWRFWKTSRTTAINTIWHSRSSKLLAISWTIKVITTGVSDMLSSTATKWKFYCLCHTCHVDAASPDKNRKITNVLLILSCKLIASLMGSIISLQWVCCILWYFYLLRCQCSTHTIFLQGIIRL